MTVRSVAVLDVGKTNVKLMVFSAGGAVEAEASMPNRVLPGPPYPHADADAVWRFAVDRLKAAARLPVDAVVVTTHGAAAAVVDTRRGGDGLALPVIDYEFDGPDAIEADYAPIRPPFAETFSPPAAHGLTVGRQLAYQKWRFPEAFGRADAILTYPQYFAWRLSGVLASEVTSLACHADLWEPANGRLSRLTDALGIRALFPPVRAPYDVLGRIRPEVAAETGLSPETAVLCGIHDSNASLVPHLLARRAPFAILSTGTWVIPMAVGGDPGRLDPSADMLSNVDARGVPVPCARFMGGREYAAIAGPGAPPAGPADVAGVIATGTLALPPFVEEGGAFAGRQGRLEGEPPATPAGRAALASLTLALESADSLERLGADTGPVIVEGTFAGNDAFLAVLQGLLPEARITAATTTAGTAFGASLLARWSEPARPAAPPDRPAPRLPLPGLAAYARRWRRAMGVED
ncbi:FGGY-family carbohydrate kinase [Prosthecomicrobium sp. N25]|uniref:FGGY-family carbohydrate kinase n=1 Tax=Prosthecomicrobium sp. N25 TaxID=3129254 RepID=UPI0030789506